MCQLPLAQCPAENCVSGHELPTISPNPNPKRSQTHHQPKVIKLIVPVTRRNPFRRAVIAQTIQPKGLQTGQLIVPEAETVQVVIVEKAEVATAAIRMHSCK